MCNKGAVRVVKAERDRYCKAERFGSRLSMLRKLKRGHKGLRDAVRVDVMNPFNI